MHLQRYELYEAFLQGGYLKDDDRIFALVLKLFLMFAIMALGIPMGYWFFFH